MVNTRKRTVILALAVLVTALTVSLSAAANPAEKGATGSSETKKEKYYILTDYEGRLAIFENGDPYPLEQLDVFVEELPERDITRIKQGIRTKSLEQALSYAEDYE